MSGAYAAPSLAECARIQMRVVGALMLREMQTRFGKRDLSLIWVFLEPLALSGAIGLLHVALKLHHSMPRVFEYYAIGYLVYFMMRSMMNRGASVMSANALLLAHRRITPLDLFFARHIIEFLTVGLVIVVFQVAVLFGGTGMPHSPIQMLVSLVLMLLLIQGLAFLIGAWTARMPFLERVTHVVSYLLLPISGVFWMVDNMPKWIQDIVLWVPTVHVFEILREGQFGEIYTYHYDPEYLVWWIVGLHLAGMSALRLARRHLVAE